MLDRLYQAFDALAEKHALFKVETIGEAAPFGLAYLHIEGSMACLPLRTAQTHFGPRENTSLSIGGTHQSLPMLQACLRPPGLLSGWVLPFRRQLHDGCQPQGTAT